MGEVHLAAHLEVEEVVVDVDAALHEVVIHDAGVKRLHGVGATAVVIHRAVKMQGPFQIVDVEPRHVGIDFCADDRHRVFFHQIERAQVGMTDVGHEVRLGLLRVAEVDQAVEIEVKLVVDDAQLAVETVFLHVAIKLHNVDMVAQQIGIMDVAVQDEIGIAFLGESGSELCVHFEFSDDVGCVGDHAGVDAFRVDAAVKNVGPVGLPVARHVGFHVADVGDQAHVGDEVVV